MERPRIHNHSRNYTTEHRADHTTIPTFVPQGFIVESMGHANVNLGPSQLNFSEAKPIHNYSVRTGEEFALEFMGDRVNPRKPLVPSIFRGTVCAPGYTLLDIPHVVSQSGSDMTMPPVTERGLKEFDRKNSSSYEANNNYSSAQSRSQNLSSYNIYHSATYVSSGASKRLSSTLKMLCSYAGNFLPRPSDGKLRYVGGETRIICINKDISWQELWRKATEICNQTHTIRYQLPGEGLDVLISVSGDEDLQNMMEEFNLLEYIEGEKKLRMFLFSIYDLDDLHLSLSNSDTNSEGWYVLALNGMDMVSRKHSGFHGLASPSANNLEELDSRNVMRETSRAITDFGNVLHKDGGSSQAQHHNYSSHRVPSSPSEIATPQTLDGLTTRQNVAEIYSQNNILGTEMKSKEVDVSTYQGTWQENENSTDEHALSSNLHDNNGNHHIPVEDESVAPASNRESSNLKDERKVEEPVQISFPLDAYSLAPTSSNLKYAREVEVPAQVSVPLDASTLAPVPNSSVNDYYSNNTFSPDSITSVSNQIGLSYFETDDLPHRVLYSEQIPRHHSSPFLTCHSHSDASPQTTKSETVEKLHNGYMTRHGGQLNTICQTVHKDRQTFDSRLARMQMSNCGVPSSEDAYDALETGSRFAAVQKESDKRLEDTTSIPNNHRHDEAVSQPMTENTQGNSQPLSGSSLRDETYTVSSSAPSRSEQGDILIDIDDRFSRDFLSEIYTKAIISDSSSNVEMMQKDVAALTPLSVNIENPEPKHWSFFQKLAGDEFARKDLERMSP